MSAKKYDFVPKSDVRQLIKVTKEQTKRINHPHARYNQLGRISCIVCGIQIKSEHAWNAHINESRELPTAPKRLAESTKPIPAKVFKPDDTQAKLSHPVSTKQSATIEAKSIAESNDSPALGEKNPAEKTREDATGSKLPEGFFDDRYKDAKVRNVPYRDKLTEELEVFQKEMISLEKQSEEIMEKESEVMVSTRELEEIDTQMQKWERIKQLQAEVENTWREKQLATSGTPSKPASDSPNHHDPVVKKEPRSDDEDEDSDSDDVDELYDFRTKNTV